MIDGETKRREIRTVWLHKGREMLVRNDSKTFTIPVSTVTREELAAYRDFLEDIEHEEGCVAEALQRADEEINGRPGFVSKIRQVIAGK